MLTPRTQVLNAAGGIIQPEGGVIAPATMDQILQLSQLGSSGLLLQGQGNVATPLLSSAGVSPAATGGDIVVAAFTIPANAFDVANRSLYAWAAGTFANNGNTKRVKIIVNPATAVVGNAVGAGGTTLIDTGNFTTAALTPWIIEGQVTKIGAAGANTQLAVALGAIEGTAHGGVGAGTAIQAVTAVENAAILIALTCNATTTATDIIANIFQLAGMN